MKKHRGVHCSGAVTHRESEPPAHSRAKLEVVPAARRPQSPPLRSESPRKQLKNPHEIAWMKKWQTVQDERAAAMAEQADRAANSRESHGSRSSAAVEVSAGQFCSAAPMAADRSVSPMAAKRSVSPRRNVDLNNIAWMQKHRALADELLDEHEQTQSKPKFVSLHALKLDLSKIPQQQQQSQVSPKQHQDHSASGSQHTVRGSSSPQRSGPVTERVVGSLTPRGDVIEPQWMQKFKGSLSDEPVST